MAQPGLVTKMTTWLTGSTKLTQSLQASTFGRMLLAIDSPLYMAGMVTGIGKLLETPSLLSYDEETGESKVSLGQGFAKEVVNWGLFFMITTYCSRIIHTTESVLN